QAVRYYKLIGSAAFSAQQQALIIKTALHTAQERPRRDLATHRFTKTGSIMGTNCDEMCDSSWTPCG
ncbi:Hypothetical predicted protein, partial [Scomber scombrus]